MASKRRLRRKACGDKVRHPTQTAAVRHLIKLQRKDFARGMRSYRCRWCGGWHVGHYAPVP